MSENSKTDAGATEAGGAPGEEGRRRGYTHSMGGYVTGLMVIACILYPFTRGIGSIPVLLVAILLMGGRAVIERQVRSEVRDLEEASTAAAYFARRSSGPSEGSKVTATTSSLGPTIIAEEATRPSAKCPCAATTRQTMGGGLSHPGCRRRCVWPGQQQRV